mmetsp:Transcript_33689/g.64664  ORF Transcript_33689/g.64664 Transcript_33689/m.64664 type:complete len:100 (+) Transcript_33689:155-454(+)
MRYYDQLCTRNSEIHSVFHALPIYTEWKRRYIMKHCSYTEDNARLSSILHHYIKTTVITNCQTFLFTLHPSLCSFSGNWKPIACELSHREQKKTVFIRS